jgi:selenocysteine lyase/cysteine desulfurase
VFTRCSVIDGRGLLIARAALSKLTGWFAGGTIRRSVQGDTHIGEGARFEDGTVNYSRAAVEIGALLTDMGWTHPTG